MQLALPDLPGCTPDLSGVMSVTACVLKALCTRPHNGLCLRIDTTSAHLGSVQVEFPHLPGACVHNSHKAAVVRHGHAVCKQQPVHDHARLLGLWAVRQQPAGCNALQKKGSAFELFASRAVDECRPEECSSSVHVLQIGLGFEPSAMLCV